MLSKKDYIEDIGNMVAFLTPYHEAYLENGCVSESKVITSIVERFIQVDIRNLLQGILDLWENKKKKAIAGSISTILKMLLELGVLSDLEYTVLVRRLVLCESHEKIAGYLGFPVSYIKVIISDVVSKLESYCLADDLC